MTWTWRDSTILDISMQLLDLHIHLKNTRTNIYYDKMPFKILCLGVEQSKSTLILYYLTCISINKYVYIFSIYCMLHACPLKSTWFHSQTIWMCYFDLLQVVCGLNMNVWSICIYIMHAFFCIQVHWNQRGSTSDTYVILMSFKLFVVWSSPLLEAREVGDGGGSITICSGGGCSPLNICSNLAATVCHQSSSHS